MRTILLTFATLALLGGSAAARDVAVGAAFQEGMSTDVSGIHRANLGGALGFGRVGIDAAIQLEIWDPYKTGDVGTKIQAAGVNLGARIAITDQPRFRGPFVAIGAGYLRLRQDYSQKRVNELFGVADIGPNAFGFRGGVGFGFATTKRVTIAVRLDVNYWLIDEGEGMNGFPAEYADESTNALSFMLVLEMLRFM